MIHTVIFPYPGKSCEKCERRLHETAVFLVLSEHHAVYFNGFNVVDILETEETPDEAFVGEPFPFHITLRKGNSLGRIVIVALNALTVFCDKEYILIRVFQDARNIFTFTIIILRRNAHRGKHDRYAVL